MHRAAIVSRGSIEWTVRALGRAHTVDDLRGTVAITRSDVPVLLGDDADIREAAAVRRGVAHRLKSEVVSARIIKRFGADTMTVAARIRAAVDDIRRTLPKGVQLRIVCDQSQLVSSALGGVWSRGNARRGLRGDRHPDPAGQCASCAPR